MDLQTLPLPTFFKDFYAHYSCLTPVQQKSLAQGLLAGKSQLICAPTASGKTLIGTMTMAATLGQGKTLYLVPLKALANEKFKEFARLVEKTPYKITSSTGEIDSPSPHLARYDVLVLTTEKLDSLLRHHVPWLSSVKTVIIDEIHLLNDPTRGPTLEIIITLLKTLIKPQIIGLSATIGNPQELANWLEAELVSDTWRPAELKQGIHCDDKTEFY